jgi:hypothetical protein
MKDLKKFILAEVKRALAEAIPGEMEAPSEQVFNGAMKTFKQQTGITIPAGPMPQGRTGRGYIEYEYDFSKEIKTAVMRSMFKELNLRVTIYPLQNEIGGFSFKFSWDYKHPQGGSNGLTIGTMFFTQGKYQFRPY